jgi:hypothetical protein
MIGIFEVTGWIACLYLPIFGENKTISKCSPWEMAGPGFHVLFSCRIEIHPEIMPNFKRSFLLSTLTPLRRTGLNGPASIFLFDLASRARQDHLTVDCVFCHVGRRANPSGTGNLSSLLKQIKQNFSSQQEHGAARFGHPNQG